PLHDAIDVVRAYTPELAARIEPAMLSTESRSAGTETMAEATAHGDFSYTQILFSGDRYGLVDYDGACRAEPGLDLGHFLAYLRFAMVKAAGVEAPRFAPLGDALEAVFLDGYRSAGGVADRAGEVGNLVDAGREDDRGGEQEGEPRRVLVVEAAQQPGDHRDAGAADAGEQGADLGDADRARLLEVERVERTTLLLAGAAIGRVG